MFRTMDFVGRDFFSSMNIFLNSNKSNNLLVLDVSSWFGGWTSWSAMSVWWPWGLHIPGARWTRRANDRKPWTVMCFTMLLLLLLLLWCNLGGAMLGCQTIHIDTSPGFHGFRSQSLMIEYVPEVPLRIGTLPQTNSSPLKMDGWNTTFLLVLLELNVKLSGCFFF